MKISKYTWCGSGIEQSTHDKGFVRQAAGEAGRRQGYISVLFLTKLECVITHIVHLATEGIIISQRESNSCILLRLLWTQRIAPMIHSPQIFRTSQK